jgi:hypothetical protein
MPPVDPPLAVPMTRRRILAGGLVGLGIGVLMLALSLFFLFAPRDSPEEVVGVMMPLVAAILGFAFGSPALLYLVLGDQRTRAVVPVVWLVVAGLALVVIVAGIVSGSLPWIIFAILPLFIDLMLVRSAFELRKETRRHRGDAGEGTAASGGGPAGG